MRRVLIAAAVFLKVRLRAAGMLLHSLVLGCRKGAFALANFVGRAVGDNDVFSSFDLRFVFDDAVFWNPKSVKSRAQSAQAPTTTAPSRASMIHPTSGPAARSGPMPGMKKNADPNRSPHIPPQKAPVLPHDFMRSPVV